MKVVFALLHLQRPLKQSGQWVLVEYVSIDLQLPKYYRYLHGLHPEKLEAHHASKEGENVTGRECGDHSWEKGGEGSGEDPVGKAAEGLTFGAMTIGEYF